MAVELSVAGSIQGSRLIDINGSDGYKSDLSAVYTDIIIRRNNCTPRKRDREREREEGLHELVRELESSD